MLPTPYRICVAFLTTALALRGQQVAAPALSAEDVLKQAPKAMTSITADDLKKHLTILSSDEYGGRLTGTPDQLKAADYIVKHFQSLGLEPMGDIVDGKRTWYFHYDVNFTEVDAKSGVYDAKNQLIHKFGAWSLPKTKEDLSNEIKGKLRFIPASGGEKSSLEDVIPVQVIDFDTSKDDSTNINDAMMSGMQVELGKVRKAAAAFAKAGARAGILVSRKFNLPFLVAANVMGIYPGKPIVALAKGGMVMADMVPKTKIPILVLGGDDAAGVLKALKTDAEKVFAQGADPKLKDSAETFTFKLKTTRKPGKAVDVAAVLRGRDPALKDEAVVYSAHMDHVGRAADGQVFNGADDDGSGTVTILELAEAYSKLAPEERPRRSILFVSVSGEELGLWGSEAFTDKPTWPLDKMVADINIDMIGRSTAKIPADTIALTPTFKYKSYSTLAREAHVLGKSFGLKMGDGDRFYTRSDHFNFAKHGIPVVFFCDDEHPDYHLPTDDVEKIEFPKMERVARLAFLLGFNTANRTEKPTTIGHSESWLPGEAETPAGEGESTPASRPNRDR